MRSSRASSRSVCSTIPPRSRVASVIPAQGECSIRAGCRSCQYRPSPVDECDRRSRRLEKASHLLTELSEVAPQDVVVVGQLLDSLCKRDATFQDCCYLGLKLWHRRGARAGTEDCLLSVVLRR